MAAPAPLRVPVELRRDRTRWFRLASAVSPEGLCFLRDLPEELGRRFTVSFHLPEDTEPIVAEAEVAEEHREDRRRVVRFQRPEELRTDRIAGYQAGRAGG